MLPKQYDKAQFFFNINYIYSYLSENSQQVNHYTDTYIQFIHMSVAVCCSN